MNSHLCKSLIPITNTLSIEWQACRASKTPENFTKYFSEIQKKYLSAHQRDVFCLEADSLGAQMLEEKKFDFAGIIYSALCKLTQYFPEQLEMFARKGFLSAKANKDPIHMMARLNDLRKIYFRNPDKLYEYIQVLYKQEKCLKELTQNYEKAVSSYQSVNRIPAPREDYEVMLAHVQTEIGKITKRKHPHDAKAKLISAREIFKNKGNLKSVEYINMLLSEIKQATSNTLQL